MRAGAFSPVRTRIRREVYRFAPDVRGIERHYTLNILSEAKDLSSLASSARRIDRLLALAQKERQDFVQERIGVLPVERVRPSRNVREPGVGKGGGESLGVVRDDHAAGFGIAADEEDGRTDRGQESNVVATGVGDG